MTFDLTDKEYIALRDLVIMGQRDCYKSYDKIEGDMPSSLINEIKKEFGDTSESKIINFDLKPKDTVALVCKKLLVTQKSQWFEAHSSYSQNPLRNLKFGEIEIIELFELIYKPKLKFNYHCRAMITSLILEKNIELNSSQKKLIYKNKKIASDLDIWKKFAQKDPEVILNVELMSAIMKTDPVWTSIVADRSVLPYLVNVVSNHKYKDQYLQLRMSHHPENFISFSHGQNVLDDLYDKNMKFGKYFKSR